MHSAVQHMSAKTARGPVLSFDLVIATRNRPEALALSIPLMLGQSRTPGKLIVIDSSDDHKAVAEVVRDATAGWDGNVIVEHASPSSAGQRNRGLDHVTAEIVIFPDDDSLFHPGTSAAIMETYERDMDGVVAGVCAAETMIPPPGTLAAARYEMDKTHHTEAGRRRWRNRLERRLPALKPALELGRLLAARHPRPNWVAPPDYSVVEYMTGFRMSFRSDIVCRTRFDETLSGYALDEDVEASFAAARHGLLVGALGARIYHHRFPGGRGDARALGATTILNRVYVMLKHIHDAELSPAEARRMRGLLRAFLRLKLAIDLVGARRPAGRARFAGVRAAIRASGMMFRADRTGLADAYLRAQEVVAR